MYMLCWVCTQESEALFLESFLAKEGVHRALSNCSGPVRCFHSWVTEESSLLSGLANVINVQDTEITAWQMGAAVRCHHRPESSQHVGKILGAGLPGRPSGEAALKDTLQSPNLPEHLTLSRRSEALLE